MKVTYLKWGVWLTLAVLMSATPCLAAEKGYCYIIAYSLQQKIAYYTPVFMQKVRGDSYNEEEFCADVELIQKMEAAFKNHLEQKLKLNAAEFTISARMAYKTQAIAKRRWDKEKADFAQKGLAVRLVAFKFSD